MEIALHANEPCNKFLRIEIVSSLPETDKHSEGKNPSNANYFSGSVDCPEILRVNTFHVSSAIVAEKSEYISKLFSSGTEVIGQETATIRIKDSDEAAIMELLNFMYSDTLSSTTAPELLNILIVADNFEVDSCVRYCSISLSDKPITTKLALLYLELLPQISLAETVQHLIDAAKLFLHSHYKDIIKFEDKLMGFPLSGIEAILSTDDLHVTSEDDVFDFVLKWANANYPKLEERREILSFHLMKYVRFPYMSSHRLVEVPKCRDLDKKLAFVSVHNALVSKLDSFIVKASFLQNITQIQINASSSGPTV